MGVATFGSFSSCQKWQLRKLPKVATSQIAKSGNFTSCQKWQLHKLPKVAASKVAKSGNFTSCQKWQLHKLLKVATFWHVNYCHKHPHYIPRNRVIIPEKFKSTLLEELHQDHPGASRMKSVARS